MTFNSLLKTLIESKRKELLDQTIDRPSLLRKKTLYNRIGSNNQEHWFNPNNNVFVAETGLTLVSGKLFLSLVPISAFNRDVQDILVDLKIEQDNFEYIEPWAFNQKEILYSRIIDKVLRSVLLKSQDLGFLDFKIAIHLCLVVHHNQGMILETLVRAIINYLKEAKIVLKDLLDQTNLNLYEQLFNQLGKKFKNLKNIERYDKKDILKYLLKKYQKDLMQPINILQKLPESLDILVAGFIGSKYWIDSTNIEERSYDSSLVILRDQTKIYLTYKLGLGTISLEALKDLILNRSISRGIFFNEKKI